MTQTESVIGIFSFQLLSKIRRQREKYWLTAAKSKEEKK